MQDYPPLNVRVETPRLQLLGATDERLGRLVPIVRDGGATANPPPWDDPSSFYESDPDARVQGWLRGIWRARGTVRPDLWRISFVAMVEGNPIGMQDLTGQEFDEFGTVESTSWVSVEARQQGLGSEMRAAILHLAFEGLGAKEAHSEAGMQNTGSNLVSERLGYQRNGTSWATHQGEPVLGQRWLLERDFWEKQRRDDITLDGVEACRAALGIGR